MPSPIKYTSTTFLYTVTQNEANKQTKKFQHHKYNYWGEIQFDIYYTHAMIKNTWSILTHPEQWLQISTIQLHGELTYIIWLIQNTYMTIASWLYIKINQKYIKGPINIKLDINIKLIHVAKWRRRKWWN